MYQVNPRIANPTHPVHDRDLISGNNMLSLRRPNPTHPVHDRDLISGNNMLSAPSKKLTETSGGFLCGSMAFV